MSSVPSFSDSGILCVHSIPADVRARDLLRAKLRQQQLLAEWRSRQWEVPPYAQETEAERRAEEVRSTATLSELLHSLFVLDGWLVAFPRFGPRLSACEDHTTPCRHR